MNTFLQRSFLLILLVLMSLPATAFPVLAQDAPASDSPEPANTYGEPAAPTAKGAASSRAASSRVPWSQETLDEVARWPIQHGGRVKPFQTFAGFLMLKANGRRTLKLEDEKLDPVAWALDFMFYPEVAKQYRCIHVPNAEVLTGIGFDTTNFRRSDRYSFDQLKPVLPTLFESARRITQAKPEAKEWTLVERQTIQLMQDIRELEVLLYSMDSARKTFGLNTVEELTAIFGENPPPGYSPILQHIDQMAELTDRDNLLAIPEDRRPAVIEALRSLQEDLIRSLEISGMGYNWFPPEEVIQTEENLPVVWTTSSEVIQEALVMKNTEERGKALSSLERLPYLLDDRPQFLAEATNFGATLRNLAATQDSGKHISTEVSFYNMDYFTKALVLFLLGFIVSCLGWLAPQSKAPKKLTWILSLSGVGMLIAGVTIRCVIQGRPPVTTLYETILFITGCCVLTAQALEYYDRRNIALTVSTFLGALGCFLSNRYELKEAVTAGDTMPSLVAVLDTNFWLSTHVTTVTLGYAAGLLAAAISHVWIFSKMLGVKKSDPSYYKSLTRMVYGTLCFGLFFSIVGTILGGIWANYSWGRFWGWDPKENGALMICLAELIILHLRMGGYIRDRGVHVLSVLNAMIIAFSWWGVNLLGVGLHSYGFTDGIFKLLAGFFALEMIVMGIGLLQKNGGGKEPPAPPAESAATG